MRAAVAIDVGGTKVAGALVGGAGELLHEVVRASPRGPHGADPGLRATLAVARELLQEARARALEPTGIGAGMPEYVSPDGRLTSREVLAWDRQPYELLTELLPGMPCRIDSDVRCGARGEVHARAGELSDFLFVSLGTGVSSALVCGGRPRAGRRGEAIALNELEVPASVDPDWAGNLESFASGEGIRRRWIAATGEDAPDARAVMVRAADGDLGALEILQSAGRALGCALGGLVAVLDPAAVVLGGGLGTADGPLHDALAAEISRRLAHRPDPPPLLRACAGERAGLIGAALLVTVPGDPIPDEEFRPGGQGNSES